YPTRIAVHSSGVYWLSEGSPKNNFADGALIRLSPDGVRRVLLGSLNNPLALAVDDSGVYVTTAESKLLAKDAALLKVAHDGSQLRTLRAGLRWPHALTLDEQRVYWADSYGGEIA